MEDQFNRLMDSLKEGLNRQLRSSDPSAFLHLLFDHGETLQIKQSAFTHPANAEYLAIKSSDAIEFRANAFSENGVQFCINPVPEAFLKNIDRLHEMESVGQPQWDRVIADYKGQLSLTSDLFDKGRTFFIEADNLPSGQDIQSNEDKLSVLKILLKSGLPVSYVIDTGGRGPHIGLVLENAVGRTEFGHLVNSVLSRLPQWIDGGVGRINQLERLPSTLRRNKSGDVVQVRLLYLGERVRNSDLDQWIATNPVISSQREKDKPREYSEDLSLVGMEEAESAAWKFIHDRELRSAGQIKRGLISVSCPEAANHKSGRDRNMSAFINVSKGFVWCSACQKQVGRTFDYGSRRSSPLISDEVPVGDLSEVKIIKIF